MPMAHRRAQSRYSRSPLTRYSNRNTPNHDWNSLYCRGRTFAMRKRHQTRRSLHTLRILFKMRNSFCKTHATAQPFRRVCLHLPSSRNQLTPVAASRKRNRVKFFTRRQRRVKYAARKSIIVATNNFAPSRRIVFDAITVLANEFARHNLHFTSMLND